MFFWVTMIIIIAIRTKTKQLEEDKQAEDAVEDIPREEERHLEGEDGSWYLGKAKEEFRRRRGKGGSSRGEEDPIQVRVSSTSLIGVLPMCYFSGRGIDEKQNANAKLILGRKTTLMVVYDHETARMA
jgi:hypothetical protein